MGYKARYSGTCVKCNQRIDIGDDISWSRTGTKGIYHVACGDKVQDKAPDKAPTPDKPITIEEKEPPTMDQQTPSQTPSPSPDVAGALNVLMEALKPRAQEAKIDIEEIKKIVRETVTEEGVLRLEIIRHELPPIKLDAAHVKLPVLLDYLKQGEHVYLYGQHGSGKSTGAMQAAEVLERMYGYISLTPQTPESRLLGYMDAHGRYVSTPFRKCYEEGGVFCLDEMDNAAPSLLTTINGALENGHCAFPDKVVARHENFVLVGTGNTSGKGANPSYPERRPFDAAFADRFQYIAWGYDEKLERRLANAICPEAEDLVLWVQKVRGWAAKNNPRFVPSPRASFRIARGLKFNRDLEQVLDSALWRGDEELKSKVLANYPVPKV